LCGADPLLGEAWSTTLGLVSEQCAPAIPGLDELEQWSDEGLVLPVLWSAYLIQNAELRAAELYARVNGMTRLGRRLGKRKLQRHGDEAYELAASAIAAFKTLGVELMNRCAAAGMSPDDFVERYPQLGWACFREFVCYGYADTQAELYDAFCRRIYLRIARLGGELLGSWALRTRLTASPTTPCSSRPHRATA